jgi:hypothetical protein
MVIGSIDDMTDIASRIANNVLVPMPLTTFCFFQVSLGHFARRPDQSPVCAL